MPTSYIGIAGLGTDAPFLPKGIPGPASSVTTAGPHRGHQGRGFSTMIVAESTQGARVVAGGGPATVRGLDTADLPYIGPGRQFGGVHRSGVPTSRSPMARSDL